MTIDVRRQLPKVEGKLGVCAALLREAAAQGYPVAGLAENAEELYREARRFAALANGEKLYTVELRYEGIREEDEEEALFAAFRSEGDLVEKTVEVAEDPAETITHADRPPAGSRGRGR